MSPTHLAHVLTKDVDWTLLPSTVPTSVAQLLKRCLTRDPRERLRDIGEARIALQAPVSDSPAEARSVEAPAIVPVWHRLVPLAGALLLGVVGAGMYFGGATTSPTASAEPTRFRLQMPDGVFSLFGEVALSPDGRTYVFRGGSDANGVSQLYRRDLDVLDAVPIPGTLLGERPFFAPDGGSLAFFVRSGGSGTGHELRRVSFGGRPTVTVCELPGVRLGGAWGPDGSIVFSVVGEQGLWRVAAQGGEPEAVPVSGLGGVVTVSQVLPDGDAVLGHQRSSGLGGSGRWSRAAPDRPGELRCAAALTGWPASGGAAGRRRPVDVRSGSWHGRAAGAGWGIGPGLVA